MKQLVEPFIKELAESHGSRSTYRHEGDDAVFTISYDQGQMFAGGGYVAYNVAASLIKNLLVNALKQKGEQLRAAPEDAIRPVILCDGGSGILGRSRFMYAPDTCGPADIARDFLRQSNSVDLILLVTVEDAPIGAGNQRIFSMKYELVRCASASISARLTPAKLSALEAALRSGSNARTHAL